MAAVILRLASVFAWRAATGWHAAAGGDAGGSVHRNRSVRETLHGGGVGECVLSASERRAACEVCVGKQWR